LGTKMSRSVVCCLLAACSACSSVASPSVKTDQVSIEGHAISLVNTNGACVLEYNANGISRSIEMVPKPPCHFLRGENGRPQSYAYKDVGVNATLIVAGTPISDATCTDWSLNEQDVCGEEAQGVLVTERGVKVTDKTLAGGVMCRDYGVDEKDYWYFAH
jgi:hypothetical protein